MSLRPSPENSQNSALVALAVCPAILAVCPVILRFCQAEAEPKGRRYCGVGELRRGCHDCWIRQRLRGRTWEPKPPSFRPLISYNGIAKPVFLNGSMDPMDLARPYLW